MPAPADRSRSLPAASEVAVATLATAATLLALDLAWLGVVARGVYSAALGPLMRPEAYWPAAALFYLFYVSVTAGWAVLGTRSLLEAARRAGVRLLRGTLMGGLGPAYETAAEVRMAADLGADVACMSTVHEVTLAAQLGAEVASLSCVTNRATGLSAGPLDHAEVTEVADRVAASLRRVLEEFLDAGA